MSTILIIEDEPELVKVLRSYLEKAGYRVLSASRGDTGLKTWELEQPDLVILDLNLPGMDGLEVAREIRRQAGFPGGSLPGGVSTPGVSETGGVLGTGGVISTPIIMLTARIDEADRLVGLELGADDYIAKPFSPREVVARVRAVLRRAGSAPAASQIVHAGDLEIDLASHSVARQGKIVELTPTEFNLLAVMAAQPGRVFSRLQLLEAAQGSAYEGYERTIDAHIKNLRAKLEPDAKHLRYIETVFGVGYRFTKAASA
jgi:two-component system alkaline phosphatase synthesis response regulator PhoP